MNKWIKISGIALVAALALTLLVGGVVLAQGPVDEDGDGVCDVCGREAGSGLMHGWRYHQGDQRAGQGAFVDENGDGICDNFVDEDGDGVCDNRAGQGQGQGYNWVDEDGDGVCDMHDQAGQPGLGGRGMRGRGRGQRNGN